nr:hypothetical protein [Tanacetum cinerariifolium]
GCIQTLHTEIVEERLKKTQAEVTEGSFKRAGDEIEQESAKRQMLEEEDDTAKLKRCLEIVPEDDDDVTIKATPVYVPQLVAYLEKPLFPSCASSLICASSGVERMMVK